MWTRYRFFALALVLTGLVAVTNRVAGAETTEDVLFRYRVEDELYPPPDGSVLFIGSSTIERWCFDKALARDFPNIPVLCRGVSGTTYRFLVEHVHELVFRYRPLKIVIYSGDNDASEGFRPNRSLRRRTSCSR